VVAHGDELVEDPAQADLVLWSTGAVDAELRIVEHDYKLPAKAAYSRAELQAAVAAGAKIIGILPDCEAAAPLRALFAGAGVQHPVVERVGDVAAARRVLEAALNRSIRVRRWKIPLAAVGAAAFGAVTLGAVALGASGRVPAELTEMLPVQIKHMLGLAAA